MLKKILITVSVLIIGIAGYYKFIVEPKVRENLPDALRSFQVEFEEMCKHNNDKKCLDAVQEYYLLCSNKHMPNDITLTNYKKKMKDYINGVRSCIETESEIKLPSIWEYIVQKE